MKQSQTALILRIMSLMLCVTQIQAKDAEDPEHDYLGSRWDPIHFKPAIDQASDEQCLKCHQEILKRTTRSESPAGIKSEESIAWYQTNQNYSGPQETFHRRHLVTPEARRFMQFKCITCHQGHDPKDEVSGSSETAQSGLILRKSVDPDICLMCHGSFDYKVMSGLSGDWPEVAAKFENDCVTCHKEYRTVRHKLNFLNEYEIENLQANESDLCYGCHGGRAWYAIPYPYVRRPWLQRMPGALPEWAKNRPTKYDARFTN
ncbi:MAG: cytochrome c3 family protein [Candidatus Thiodiazotropha taylori]|uniref:Cytochrome c3 family protein n=1 Tax=Candidatus Thiodiazotropha taylori TaxID=2792791 RepID=A0A9E4P6I9_9GAMM|nr:cytochrome c3 family protein [Candidatus Thiodiazotropha taylori]RLW64296.1 MAG: hypothetical protein B6D73_12165 [gamma proteobacterium symbiont of Stewartia floridana]MCG7966169.1 cytochrome c3 family protein [Candidatus Thiodiazotropha taylori]MCG8029258.1 cytochrome c3 family protein [Candidatus Thiodiazotropha taylori]MCG8041408.1 cytochrome c3 family protein [Candidatus Thiodiazotropha taylori]